LITRIYCIFFLLTVLNTRAQDPYFINYTTEDGLPSSQTYQAYEDSDGNMWFTTDRGVVRYDSYTFKTFTIDDGLANLVNFSFYKENEKTFWVNGYDGSFSYWNGEKFIPFKYNWIIKKYLKEDRWFNILNITDTKLVFCLDLFRDSPKEYFEINLNTGEVSKGLMNDEVVVDPNISHLVKYKLKDKKDQYVYIEMEDKNGFWRMTTALTEFYPQGILDKAPIILYEKIPIAGVFQSSQGYFWFTTLDRGLLLVPSLDMKELNVKSDLTASFESLKLVNDFLLAKVSGRNRFLALQNETNYETLESGKAQNNAELLKKMGLDVQPHMQDLKPNLLKLSTDQYAKIGGSYFELKSYHGRSIHKHYYKSIKILCALEDKNKVLWAGSTKNLFRMDLKSSTYNMESVDLVNSDTVEIRINDMILDRGGLWLASLSKGLFYKKDKTIQLKHSKLMNKTFECFFKENDSTIWVGTNKGLLKIDYYFSNDRPKILNITTFTTNDGLNSNKINDIIYWRNKLFIATATGISYFDSSKLKKKISKPKIKIERVVVNRLNSIFENDKSLDYDQNNIRVSFKGFSLNKPISPGFFYRYKLNDENWNYTNANELEYQSLDPNTYRLIIQCQNNDGIWSDAEELEFTINPHFSQLLSFRVVVVLMLVFGLFVAVRFRIRASKKKISKELRYKESELATLRNQINPHFIFNSLNTLQDYIYDGDLGEANQYIGDFSTLMRKSLEFSKMDKISLLEEIRFIENYLTLEKRRYEHKFDFVVLSNTALNREDIFIVPLMVQPLVENAVKHAFKNFDDHQKGLIEVNYQMNHNNVLIAEIIDNGSGFELDTEAKGSIHRSMGLKIIQQRIELINQRFDKKIFALEHIQLERGTKMKLTLPILQS